MKNFKYIVIVILCIFCNILNAQIGINTLTPAISLAIVDNATGFDRTSSHNLSLKTNGVSRLHFDQTGNVGINQPIPLYKFDINADNKFLRFQNLANLTASTNDFVVLSNSFFSNPESVGKKTITAHTGQYMRFGINSDNIPRPCDTDCGGQPAQKEWAVRFYGHNSASEMGNAPTNEPNFHHSISGAFFEESQTLASGNGAPARTTDRIVLPSGVYRLTFKYSGKFETEDDQNHLDLKIIVNNNEYSFANAIINGNGSGSTIKSGNAVETIVLLQESRIDFTYVRETPINQPGANFVIGTPRSVIGSTNAYQSYILIEKLQ